MERLVFVLGLVCLTFHALGLAWIVYCTIRIVRMGAEVTALVTGTR